MAHTSNNPQTKPTQDQIRARFIEFFKDRGSEVFASSSLVPEDPSLLLTNAGMNQFKQYYLGTKSLKDAIGATSCQKCLRTNDIEVIGLDGRHLSFFEMLGNFSFGGYDKRQACAWALEFVTRELGLSKDVLYFTVFEQDDEAEQIWLDLGIDASHISRLGEDDNFWAAGPTGPCGPCSEIYVDLGEAVGCGSPDCAPGCDCDRFLEIWNLVFTQYDRQADGTLVDLPHQNVDTGMGLERVSAVVKGETSSYASDVLAALLAFIGELLHKTYGQSAEDDISLRIIADHARAVTFMLADGILPSNEGRGYVLRRLLRRAVFHARMLGATGAYLAQVANKVCELMQAAYPELAQNHTHIMHVIEAEEARFLETLATGETYLQNALGKLEEGKPLGGDVAFTLHDTYGFPIDLTQEIAEKAGVSVDLDAFNEHMEAQRARARASSATAQDAWSNVDIWTAISEKLAPTAFIGYTSLAEPSARIETIVVDGEEVSEITAPAEAEIVLNTTPFYAEKGGQVGDTGKLSQGDATFAVQDTTVKTGDVVAHKGELKAGTLHVGDVLDAQVDGLRRALIARNHTATHLLDEALKQVLGEHVNQAGSLVSDTHLRFDFTHYEALTKEQLAHVEDIVNQEIIKATPVTTAVMPIEQAKAEGAVALFGEKYGDEVRVVTTGAGDAWFSKELCGGTHVTNTSELGFFKIVGESSVGAGQRRIEAVTSQGALAYVDKQLAVLEETCAFLKTRPKDLLGYVQGMKAKEIDAKAKMREIMTNAGSEVVSEMLGASYDCGAYKVVVAKLEDKGAGDLRAMWDQIKSRAKAPVACFLIASTPQKKTALLSAATPEAVKAGFDAGKLIKQVCEKLGGRGGGKPQMAQGGLDDPSLRDAAIKHVKDAIEA